MDPGGSAYSSALLRDRDAHLQARHQIELAAAERRTTKLRAANDDLLAQLFVATNRAAHLAHALGFRDVAEAQVAVDTAESEMTFAECLAAVGRLEREVAGERERVAALEGEAAREREGREEAEAARDGERAERERVVEELRAVREERDALRVQLAAVEKGHSAPTDTSSAALAAELADLQSRYATLLDVKARAAERYKADFKKWRDFKQWLFDDTKPHRPISEAKRAAAKSVMRKDRILAAKENADVKSDEDDAALLGLSALVVPKEEDKENVVPATPQKTRKTHALRLSPGGASVITPKNATANLAASSGLTLNFSRTSIGHPVFSPPTTPKKLDDDSPTDVWIPRSSQTEADSQFPGPLQASSPPGSPNFKRPATPPPIRERERELSGASSETEDESQLGPLPPVSTPLPASTSAAPAPTPAPFPPLSPLFFPASPPSPPQASTTRKPKRHSDIGPAREDGPPPRKVRRLSGSGEAGAAAPDLVARADGKKADAQPTLKAWMQPAVPGSRKGKARARDADATPQPASGAARRLDDYSAYKGRGRYAAGAATGSGSGAGATINARFAIDPARNGGVAFAFDEVVRARAARRQLDAGDCEECRDYYEAVGPLPGRLQAPLWRSPSATPTKARPCARPCARHHAAASAPDDDDADGGAPSSPTLAPAPAPAPKQADALAAHKQAVSRHRHQWERARTPPGYWSIGFPTTQETAAINVAAAAMHAEKRAEIETAVRAGGGRYVRR